MVVLRIVYRSLIKALNPENFLPFFLLYLMTGICVMIFILPIIDIIPNIMSAEFQTDTLIWNYFNIISLITVLFFVFLIYVWFKGAMICKTRFNKKSFIECVTYVRKVYLGLIAYVGVVFIINSVVSFIPNWASAILWIITWFIMFSEISIVIRKDTVEVAILRSISIVRNNKLQTLILHTLIGFMELFIILVGLFIATIPLAPGLKDARDYLVMVEVKPTEELLFDIVKNLVNIFKFHYFEFLIFLSIASLFTSIASTFNMIARTNYFLITKVRRRKPLIDETFYY